MANHHPRHPMIMEPLDERIEGVAACNDDDDDDDDAWHCCGCYLFYSYVMMMNIRVVQPADDDTMGDVSHVVEDEPWMMMMTMMMMKVKGDNKLLLVEASLVTRTTCSRLLHEP